MSIEARIKTTREVIERNLAIPDYQRPYRWTTKNAMQLLEDICASMAARKREYRIGTVIYHKPKNSESDKFNIVDGQQRLTTILLVLHELTIRKDVPFENRSVDDDESKFTIRKTIDAKLKDLKYKGDSVAAICENTNFIKGWLRDNLMDDGLKFSEYILNSCKFAEIVVDDLGEAFQMFDTQNGRGRSLELYNLLKAYHIRAMEQNTQEEKIQCDRNWENATQYDATPDIQDDPNVDILKQLFSEQLFKSRLQCRKEDARVFCRDDIGEFKGCTIDKNHSIDFPFQNPFLLQYLTEKFYRNVLAGTIGTKSRLEAGETEKLNPFVNINQPIINGRAFFEYIETYVELYKKMFIDLGSYQLADFKRFFYLFCLSYKGDNQEAWEDARGRTNSFRDVLGEARRNGDTYLREAYKSICFVLLDKFGERVFRKYYKTLYRLIYKVRIENYAVRQAAAFSLPTELFTVVYRAKDETDLLELNKRVAKFNNSKYDYADKLPEKLGAFIKTGECHE